ncbi:LysR family transcriptional regulator [Pigmentiphaga sp. H8]|uniref:LysR family transcriptional regulator n=1 Tax=Pigmentiphaga sp. H8 TaxID=2488560 RepID=UPI000F59A3CF|nr:LysR family transcriptional regulator [Pigmentiphaga sp. H8]AZG07848.1 LysR family transcriptional regulator [Pigmentiphaga sp. H8]
MNAANGVRWEDLAHFPELVPHARAGMDPRKLLYLATIIEQGSLAKAARLLAISQPALSKSMNRLEEDLGMKLLVRSPAGIEPTMLGELIYSHARHIRDEMDLASTRLKGDREQSRMIVIGVLPSLASTVIPLAVARWSAQRPDVLLRVVEKIQVELLLGLLRCEFDFIVGQTEFYDFFLDGLKQRVLFRDRLCIFARSGHELFEQPELTWANLARYPWVCTVISGPQRGALEKLLASEVVDNPRHLVECGSIDFMKTLISASDHLALLPAHSAVDDVKEGTIKALPITVPALKRDIAVIFRERAPLTDESRSLLAHVQEVGSEFSCV